MVVVGEDEEAEYRVQSNEEQNQYQHINDGRQGLEYLSNETSNTTQTVGIDEKDGAQGSGNSVMRGLTNK